MAFTFEELVGSVRTTGADQSKRQVDSVRHSFRTLGDTIESLGTLGGLSFLFSQLQDLGRTLGQVTGVGIAAQFMGISRALVALTGSGEKANRMMEQFKRLGMQSAFDTAEVAGMGAKMLGAGVSETRLMPDLQALLDLASHGMGLSRQDFPEFTRNLLQIRGRGTGKADMADINQLKDRVPQIGNFIAAGIGGGIGREDALKQAQSMTGRELYDTIIKGSEAMAKGAAAAKASLDPLAAWANVMETFQIAMEPTGKLLLPLIMQAIAFAQSLADVFKNINKATFGLAGLAVVLGVGLVGATVLAVAGIGAVTAAISALAAVSGMVAGTQLAALASNLSSFLLPVLRFALPALAIGAVAHLAGNKMRGDGKNQRINEAGNLLEFGLAGAGIGAILGAGIPGALIGGLVGTIVGGIYNAMGGAAPAKEETNKQVEEQKKTNRILENLHATVRGGGPRTSAEASRFVAELQLHKFMSI